ncbi:2-oxoglutarate-dependent dioxygenase 21, chloroplastic isoform X3 [Ziziphus jujuba]|uniref:2-oxoglutarate-dependent dioxygenase 21, chloroplastic isoform X3 n=1 Tax=Ziziphus jujuba TaxID=326968 RepID=A0ABM4AEC3_ZIZJJ|nr:2-oxoglutarate-dependent dioxygenase 21, chloroplastic isoform X3 [Ziziphus jujuba]
MLTVASKYYPIKENGSMLTFPVMLFSCKLGIILSEYLVLQILSNGKNKSHVHRVVVEKNKARRLTVATLHGPSLDTFVSPAVEFLDDSHPPLYRGKTYKQSLEANGHDEIDVQFSLQQIRLA